LAGWRRLFEEPRRADGPVLLVTSNGAARFALLAAGLEAQAGMKLPTGGFGVIVPEPGGLRLACWGSGPDGGVRALVARAAVSWADAGVPG
jgi:probable phosphoglycerate mutase